VAIRNFDRRVAPYRAATRNEGFMARDCFRMFRDLLGLKLKVCSAEFRLMTQIAMIFPLQHQLSANRRN
jgi:hypothetical protein